LTAKPPPAYHGRVKPERDPEERLPIFLIASPIGDILSDFSLSALEILKRVRHVFIEDIALEHPDLLHKRLQKKGVLGPEHRLYFISENRQDPQLFGQIDRLVQQRESFALLADKGLPCFLDPGLELVRHLLDRHGEQVELVPVGVSSAFDAAIALCGVDCSQFVFLGHFPDNRKSARNILSFSVPNIVYVKAGAWKDFVSWLREILGRQLSRARLVALSNIRQLQNRRRGDFSLLDPGLELFEDKNVGGHPPPNHLAVVYWRK
jgi:hypothetical protein